MIKLKTHPYPVNIWFATDWGSFNRKRSSLWKLPLLENDGEWGMCSHGDSGKEQIVGIFVREQPEATLMHECCHAAINVMDYVGIPITGGSQEAFCYFADSIFNQCLTHMRKKDEK